MTEEEATMHEDDLGSLLFWQLPADAYEDLLVRAHKRRKRSRDKVLRSQFPSEARVLSIQRKFLPYKHLIVQKAFPAVFEGWDHRILGDDPRDESAVPTYERVAVAPDAEELALLFGVFVFDHPDGRRLVARVFLTGQFGLHDMRTVLEMACRAEDRDYAQQKLDDIADWIDEHNHLRGQRLLLSGRFIKQSRPYSWDDLYLEPGLLAHIKCHTAGFLTNLDRYRALKLPARRGVLVHGRPGSGKTLLGKVICSQVDATFIAAKPGDLGCTDEIVYTFAMARELAPTVLFLEDIDLFGGTRGRHQLADALLGELMNQLDGIEENDGLLVMATTNDLGAVEPALKERPSRFDVVVEMPEVSTGVRRRYLQDFLAARDLDASLYTELDRATSKCRTIAEVQEAVVRFFQRAIEQGIDVRKVTSPDELPAFDSSDPWQPEREQIGFMAMD